MSGAGERLTFGQRVRALRRAKGISQRDLAARIGRDFTYLSKIETGRCLPPAAAVIVALAAHLDTDVEELAALGNKPSVATLRARLAESEARVRELEAENGRLRPALIHTRRMVTAHHSIGECRVCLTESGTTTWDEGDTALRGAEGHTAERP